MVFGRIYWMCSYIVTYKRTINSFTSFLYNIPSIRNIILSLHHLVSLKKFAAYQTAVSFAQACVNELSGVKNQVRHTWIAFNLFTFIRLFFKSRLHGSLNVHYISTRDQLSPLFDLMEDQHEDLYRDDTRTLFIDN